MLSRSTRSDRMNDGGNEMSKQCYEELQLPVDPQEWIDASLAKLTDQIKTTTNGFAAI